MTPEEIKKIVIEALNIGHLSPAEQDKILADLGGALMERATYALLMAVPPEEFARVDALADEGKDAEMVEEIRKLVPNAQEIVENSIKSGVDEYKRLVNEEVAKRAGGTPAAAPAA